MANSDEVAIKVTNVHKTFKLPHEKQSTLKGAFLNMFNGKRTYEKQHVLKDISFEIKKGEFFGIVGRNGSGKSTLLKLLAGIYSPDSGHIQVNGKLTPFIELGVGFNPELTGRENVFLNGALLGFNRKEMMAMYNEIVEFAELEKFMDQKLKNYSSGMQVRLAFSIAIRSKSDVLLVDEVLAVGDAAFQQKCYEFFAKMKDSGRTLILVTHDMSAVLRFCDRAMLINQGILPILGSPKDVADKYMELNFAESRIIETKNSKNRLIQEVSFVGKTNGSFTAMESLRLRIKFRNVASAPVHFGIQVFNNEGTYCFGTNTRISKKPPSPASKGIVTCNIKLALVPGHYTVTVACMDINATRALDYLPNAVSFNIENTTEQEGIALLEHEWDT